MEDGVIGAFAYEKIQKAISLLKKQEYVDFQMKVKENSLSDEDRRYIHYILEILGDPLMREIMEQMWERGKSE